VHLLGLFSTPKVENFTFWGYQCVTIPKIWTKLNPKLFPIPNFRIPNPILFSIPNFYDTEPNTFFDTESKTIKKWQSFELRSFETETSHSGTVYLWPKDTNYSNFYNVFLLWWDLVNNHAQHLCMSSFVHGKAMQNVTEFLLRSEIKCYLLSNEMANRFSYKHVKIYILQSQIILLRSNNMPSR